MFWVNFLHIYQPVDQQPDILEQVATQSYRPLLLGIAKNNKARLTLNINGALLELFDKYGYRDLIDLLRTSAKEGRIEFTGSAKYHAFLPFLGEQEIIRQISINQDTLKYYLGARNAPRGFFPPEMGYKEELSPIIEQLGFQWIILDEIAYSGIPGQIDQSKVYTIKNTKLNVFFRERRLSNLVMSAVARSPRTLLAALKDDLTRNKYIVTGMDGETFGHHRPGMEKILFKMWNTPPIKLIQISEVTKYFKKHEIISPIKSTWASSQQDIENSIQFLSWSDPSNIIHKWQWGLVDLALKEVYAMDKKNSQYQKIRTRLDIDLASDHFWWASAKPWWSLEMIEAGAYHLLETIRLVPKISKLKLAKALDFYEKIISTAFAWQRSGKIRRMANEQNEILRIPFYDRTIGRGGAEKGVFEAFLKMMRDLETKAAQKGEYEKAILWRDAIYKLKHKWDIYDTINAIDLVRLEIPHKKVEIAIAQYKNKYRQLRGGQPEQRGA